MSALDPHRNALHHAATTMAAQIVQAARDEHEREHEDGRPHWPHCCPVLLDVMRRHVAEALVLQIERRRVGESPWQT